MKTNLLLGILLAALAGLPAAAAAPAAADSNRYLLVFETTRGMKRDMAATRQCVQGLINGDFADQVRDGDTIGVWTYDSSLHAGIVPMQEWTEDGEMDMALHLDEFLKQQHCKGDAHFDEVMTELKRVVTDSDSVTILIFSDGYDPIHGTPFDNSINGVYTQHRQELHDAHVPFVTILQGEGGKIVHGTVDSAVGPIDIPAPPSKPGVPAPVEAPAPAPAPPPVVIVKTNAPLILDYSKVTPKNPPTPAPAASQAPAAPANNPPPAPGLVASTLSAITNMIGSSPAAPTTSAGAAAPAVESQPAPSVTVPPQATAAVPANSGSQGGLILAGLGLLLALGGLAALFFWRSRSSPRASVITESFKQTKK